MQLIFETENTNINISLKMSAIDEETLNENPLPNGGIKEIMEEVNEKLEANGTGNGENVQNKENILNNGEVENRKESEDITVSAEKPTDEPAVREEIKEAGDIISVDKSIVECPLAIETKEVGDDLPAEKVIKECALIDEIIQSGEDVSADISKKECSLEEKSHETEHVISAEKPLNECTSGNESEKSSDVACAEISADGILAEESTLPNEVQRKSEQLDQESLEQMELAKLQSTEEENEDHQKSELLDQEPVEQMELAKQQPTEEENEDYRKSEQLDQELVEQMELAKQQPTEEENEDHRKSKQLDQEPVEQMELAKQQPTEENEDYRKSEQLDQESMEKMRLAKQQSTEEENEDHQKSELLDQDPVEQMELAKQQPTQEEMPQLEIEEEMPQLELEEEVPQLEIKQRESDENIKPNETEDANTDLDKPVEKLCEETSSETKIDSVPSENTKESENNIIQNTEDVTDKVDLANSDKDKVESMEIDENYGISIEKDLENISENDITQSISDMVGNIVQSLNDDTADDFMEDIEIDNNDKVEPILPAKNSEQDIAENSTVDKITDKTERENVEEIVKEVSEQIAPQKEEQDKMDIDEEDADNIIETTLISNQASSVNTKENEASQTPSKTTDTILSESNNVDNKKESKVAENSINSDINLPSSVDNAIEVSTHKVAQNDTTVENSKENKKEISETDVSEVIELKSGDSSTINMDDVDSSILKMEDDIISLISNNIEKDPDSTTNKDDTLTPDKQTQVAETKDDALDIEEVKMIEDKQENSEQKDLNEKTPEKVSEKSHTPIIKLSNTMDILSDEEDEPSTTKASTAEAKNESRQPKGSESPEKQCINLVDDDDIMLIDEDTKEDKKDNSQAEPSIEKVDESQTKNKDENVTKDTENKTIDIPADVKKDSTKTETDVKEDPAPQLEVDKSVEAVPEKQEKPKPLIPPDFFKTYRKNLADMTRDDLEEFCILKIVESIIDRSNLNDIRSKLKSMALTIDEYKKKAMMISKQNRDLQVVLKSVQEEQKKVTGNQPITPLKITRSVGMQVLMTDKNGRRVMPRPGSNTNTNQVNNRNVRTPNQSPRNTPQKQVNSQAIPVPRLVPAGMNVAKPTQINQANNIAKATAVQNGVKNTPPAQKPEKRTHSRMQSQSSSVTVDLTDDEPPPKVATKTSPAPPVRLVNPQNLLAPRQQFSQQVNSPRKVYIPISINGPQGQHTRPGQTLMLKTVGQGPRPRGPGPTIVRTPQSTVPVRKVVGTRHPAPLPDAMKQYQPPNWKALPPAPDLKLSKVENGIVISWKIEGYQEDSYEDIASYQLYAYQETSAPPSTSLWKKIGDVKALPLPMACTLTQFMAGYKYYFAVRAVDIRSRLGPFSLPGSILLLNKM